ncbi:MAG TPA: cytochrome c3 family protein, partial [Candidatus Methylomirabilis sp.]|nr:cytochrome c3 family protein [Candidatus Methylomirabilis sp.]
MVVALMLAACAQPGPAGPAGASRFGRAPVERAGRFAAKACLDSGCHAPKKEEFKQAVVHAPVREEKCEACHQRHGLVGAIILTKDGSELCYSCHAPSKAAFQKAHQHTALKDAAPPKIGCVGCHDPHASAVKGLLKRSGNDLCFACHKKEQFAGKTTHAV